VNRGPILPVGVVIPVRNSRPALPHHLGALAPWLHRVEEVVAVDSDSSDGTADYLCAHLRHSSLLVLNHPPGLYQSWNQAISQVSSRYVYIATVGETIEERLLERLIDAAEQFSADVVISAPQLLDSRRRRISKEWPVHRLLADRGIRMPVRIPSWEWFGRALVDFPATLIGSSASNLYRTSFLQKLPFPTEYGHAGDSAWAVRHAFTARFAIEPRCGSTFWLHPQADGIRQVQTQVVSQLLALPHQTWAAAESASGLRDLLAPLLAVFDQMGPLIERRIVDAAAYRAARQVGFPRSLAPGLWRRKRGLRQQKRLIEQHRQHLRRLLNQLPW
jgi:hypothetical protein